MAKTFWHRPIEKILQLLLSTPNLGSGLTMGKFWLYVGRVLKTQSVKMYFIVHNSMFIR